MAVRFGNLACLAYLLGGLATAAGGQRVHGNHDESVSDGQRWTLVLDTGIACSGSISTSSVMGKRARLESLL